MTFADLALGASVFLDANTLLYHFTADAQFGAACTDLVERMLSATSPSIVLPTLRISRHSGIKLSS
jgi:hypothetical protein